MLREIDLNKVSDGKLYGSNDMQRMQGMFVLLPRYGEFYRLRPSGYP